MLTGTGSVIIEIPDDHRGKTMLERYCKPLSRSAAFLLLTIFICFAGNRATAQLPPKIDGLPPFPETATFNIDLADIYAEIFPKTAMAEVICNLWLTCDGINPVLLRLEGNIIEFKVSRQPRRI